MCVICMYICVNVCKCYGNLRVQSTVLDGLQGSFGGRWRVLWFREGPGGGLKNVLFSFFRGEFVIGLMKY